LSTRERLLEAAYKCFSQKGYVGATTKEISRLAGVSEVTLFRHFGSKRELFSEVLVKYSVIPVIEAIGKSEIGLSGRELVEWMGVEILKSLQERRDFLKILLSEVPKLTDEVKVVYSDFSSRLFKVFLNAFALAFPDLPMEELKLKVQIFRYCLFGFFLSNEIFQGKRLTEREIREFIRSVTDEIAGGKA